MKVYPNYGHPDRKSHRLLYLHNYSHPERKSRRLWSRMGLTSEGQVLESEIIIILMLSG